MPTSEILTGSGLKCKVCFTFCKKYITFEQNNSTMEPKYLLPAQLKIIGWTLFIPTFLLGMLWLFYEPAPAFLDMRVFALLSDSSHTSFIENNVMDELLGSLMIISSVLVAFSKERDEDELISKLRLESLVWATYWNYGILLLTFILLYDGAFWTVMILNLFTILIFFIIKFNWAIWNLRKSARHEE